MLSNIKQITDNIFYSIIRMKGEIIMNKILKVQDVEKKQLINVLKDFIEGKL